MDEPATAADPELLLAYAAHRNADAFAELVRRYAALVHGVGLRITGNSEDARDVAQECFLQLAAKAGQIAQPLPAWLHTFARSRAIDLTRRRGARQRNERQASRCESLSLSLQEWQTLSGQVDAAIEALDEDLRLPLIGQYLQGRTQQELAQSLGVSQGTISRRIERAIERLREHLRTEGVDVPATAMVPLLAQLGSTEIPAGLLGTLNKIGLSGVGAATSTASAGAVAAKIALAVLALAVVAGIGFSLSSAYSGPRGAMATTSPTTAPMPATSASPVVSMQLDLGDGMKMDFVSIPAGQFRMGESPGKPEVIAKPFYLGKYLVTRREFALFIKDTAYQTTAQKEGKSPGVKDGQWQSLPGANWKAPGFDQTDEDPVVCVSPDDAQAFCAWLSQKTGQRVRLPRDAEWEYACRAGTQTTYFWGDDPMGGAGFMNAEDGKSRIEKGLAGQGRELQWVDGYRFTSPVGTFKPNPWGLCDMLGNLWEPTTDPMSFRGGTWDYPPSFNRCSLRQDAKANANSWDTGFRVAMDDDVRRADGKVWIDGLQPGERDTSPYAQGLSIILQHLGHRDADYIRVMGYSGVAFGLQMDLKGPIHDGRYDVAWWPNDSYVFEISLPLLSRAFGRELRKVPYTRGQTDYKREYQDRFEPAIIEAINQGHPVLGQEAAAYLITGYDQPNHKPIGLWPTPGQPVFGPGQDGIPWGLFVAGKALKSLPQDQAEIESLRWAIALWDETAAAGTKDWDTSTILTGSKAYAKWLELLQQQADDKGLGRDSWDNNLICHLRYNRTAAVAYLRDVAQRQPAAAAGHLRAAADLYQQVLDDTANAPFYGQFTKNPEVRPAKLREYTEMVRRVAQLEAQAIDELRQVVSTALPTR